MTTVTLWFRDSLDTESINGDLVSLTNNLNVAAANGKQFTILENVDGEGVMIHTQNILKAREVKADDAFVS